MTIRRIPETVLARAKWWNGSTWVDATGDATNGLDVDVTRSVLPTGASTLAEQQTQTASLSVLDDWDESDRAKVNLIAGQAGVQGASGLVNALTQRVVLATDVALPAGNNNIGDVDVLSVVPGTGATNLGKAEDDQHNTGDTGVFMLGVANLDDIDFTSGVHDYTPIAVTSKGLVRVSLPSGTVAGSSSLPAGTNNIGDVDVATIAAGTTRIGGTYTVNGQIIDENGTVLTVKVAHLDMTTATTTDIVAAVAAKKIRVLQFCVAPYEATATVVNFARGAGTTRITGSGLLPFSATVGVFTPIVQAAPPGAFLFETASGEALRVTQTGATDLSVSVTYIEV